MCPAGGLFSILLWGAKGSRDVKLPITVGPLKGGEKVRPALQHLRSGVAYHPLCENFLQHCDPPARRGSRTAHRAAVSRAHMWFFCPAAPVQAKT